MPTAVMSILEIDFKVSQTWWLNIIKCHDDNAHLSDWKNYQTVLFRAGLDVISRANGLGTMLVDASEIVHKRTKSLNVYPTPAEIQTLDQICGATGYSREELTPRIIRIGYTAIC